jgi:biopolymer transport protein ExbD
MAFTSGGSGGLTNEINVTPMIDVLLVLLIIFMAAIPSMRKSIDVQLPDPTPSTAQATQSNQIVLEVMTDGYSINSEKVDEGRLGPRLKEIYDPRPEKIIFVKGDPKVKYERVVHAMDVSRGAGVKVIGVPPKDTPGSAATTKK